jgi:iron only hydrogenase large subunit-like protein
MGESSGAAAIFGASGGVMEAALRTAADALGLEGTVEYKGVRGVDRGVKEITIEGERCVCQDLYFCKPF